MAEMRLYRTYNFIDKDPVIDYARTRVFANGGPSKVSIASNVSSTTLYGWFKGRTRRPQFSTIAAVLLACGEDTINLRAIGRKGRQ